MTPTVNMPSSAPARKVVGATAGAGIGGVTANLLVWALDDTVFQPKVPNSVPDAVSAFVLVAVPLLLAFVGGYFTRRGTDELIAPAPRSRRGEGGYASWPLLVLVALCVVVFVLAVRG